MLREAIEQEKIVQFCEWKHIPMFAVPNGCWRNETTAAKLKLEGVLPGVSDLILLLRRGESGALLIEMKTEK